MFEFGSWGDWLGTIRAQVFSRLLGIVDSEVWQESWGYEGTTASVCFLF